jgi:glutamine amidotransferase-like uncharacterized protein
VKNMVFIYKLKYLIVTILIIYSCKKDDSINPEYILSENESSGIKIGLYLDSGVWDECRTGTQSMFNEMNCNYTSLNKDSILNGTLNHYNLFIMPGGDMWKYRDFLTTAGMNKIKEYVSNGGGYIGICGGGYFAASKIVWHGWANEPRINISINGLGLFSGTADGPMENFAPTYEDAQCKIKIIDKNHPLCKDVPDVIKPYYSFGPNFIPNDPSNISIIGRTINGDSTVIIAFQHYQGRVFLSGPHFEFDETRSSWGLLKNAILWCSAKVVN